MGISPTCPAAEIVHPVLSPHADDVQCRVQGGLRPARSSPDASGHREPAICCALYTRCSIWRVHKEIHEFGPSTKRQRDAAISGPRSHTLSGDLERDIMRF